MNAELENHRGTGGGKPTALVRAIPDADLRQLAREALSWQKTGMLVDGVLRELAARLVNEVGLDSDYALQHADSLVLAEAARRFAEQ